MIIFHLISLTFVVVCVFLSDKMAMSWIRGTKQTLPENKLHLFHRLVWLGLGLMIVTGFFMFWERRDYLLHRPAFLVKMFFVGLLFINSFFVGKLLPIAIIRPYASLTMKEKIPLFLSGVISTVSWVSAAILAFFIYPD